MKMETEKPQEIEAHRHLHRCQNCGVIWGHGNMMADDVEAHKCPKCGRTEWRHFSGGQAVKRERIAAEKPTPYKDLFLAVLGIAALAAAMVILVDVLAGWLTPTKA
jgi:hypothetical protein